MFCEMFNTGRETLTLPVMSLDTAKKTSDRSTIQTTCQSAAQLPLNVSLSTLRTYFHLHITFANGIYPDQRTPVGDL